MRAALAARDVGPMFELLKAAGVSQRQIGEYTQQSQSEISEIHTVQAPGVRKHSRSWAVGMLGYRRVREVGGVSRRGGAVRLARGLVVARGCR